jgi:hypothetical protein
VVEQNQSPAAKSQEKDEFAEAMNSVPALAKFTETGHVFTTPKQNVND